MANVIQIKRKTTTGAPALAQLAIGELCYVVPDNAFYIKKDASTIILMSGAPAPVTTRIRRSTNQSIPNGSSWTDLMYDTSAYQVNGTFWSSGATVTIPESGYYQVYAEATFDGAGLIGTITANMEILVNGATVIGDDEKQVFVNATAPLWVMAQRFFSAGDTVKVQLKHSNASAVNVLAQGDHSPDIIVTKLTGAKGDSTTISTVEVNLGSMAKDGGSFQITGLTGLTTGKQVLISQAAGPYTGKGDMADEAEMDMVTASGYVLNATTIQCYWSSRYRVGGNIKFNYIIQT